MRASYKSGLGASKKVSFFGRTGVRLALLFLIVLLPIGVMDVYDIQVRTKLEVARTQEDLQRLAGVVAQKHEGLVESAHDVLVALAQLEDLRKDDLVACSEILTNVAEQYARYTVFSKVDTDGYIICGSMPVTKPVDVSWSVNIKNALTQKKFSLSRFVIGPISGKPVLVFTLPMLDAQDNVLGLLNTGLNLDWLDEFLKGLNLPSGSQLRIFDQEGTVLASFPEGNLEIGATEKDILWKNSINGSASGSFVSESASGRILTGYDSLEQVPGGLYITLSRGYEKALAGIRNEAYATVSIHLLSLLLSLGLAWVASKKLILRWLDKLVNHAERLAEGDLEAETGIPYDAGDMGRLAAAYDDMAQELRDREQDLTEGHENLRALINASEESAFLSTAEGVVITANDKLADRLGVSVGDLVGRSIYDFLPALLADFRKKKIQEVIDTKQPLEWEDYRSGFFLKNKVYPIFGRDGEVERLAVFSYDITGQVLASTEIEKLTRAVEQSPASVFITNPEGIIEYINPKFSDVTGFQPEEVLGKTPNILKSGRHPNEFYEDLWTTIESGNDWRGEVCNKTKDGREIWEILSISPVTDENGNLLHYVAVKEDITEMKQAADALKESEERMKAMSRAAHDALIVIDSSGKVTFWNPAAEKLFGYTIQEAVGQDVHELIAPKEMRNEANEGLRQFAETGEGNVVGNVLEFIALRKDGSEVLVERAVASFKIGDRWFAVGSVRDITERKQVEEKLREMATIDALTKLSNRRFFMERAQEELRRAQRYGNKLMLFMMDIDYFKKVNDSYGHSVGDDVLKRFAELLRINMRDTDIIGRVGGEEFAVVLPRSSKEDALDTAGKIRTIVENDRMESENGSFSVTVSIGIAQYNGPDDDLESLLKRADQALYRAKDAGRNRVELG